MELVITLRAFVSYT